MRAFIDAFRGLAVLVATQRHAKIHVAALLLVVVFGLLLKISAGEWCSVLLAAGLVLMAEALNTAVEDVADAVHPDEHPLIGRAKDVAAGGVLVAAIMAVAVGLIVFVPKLLSSF